MAEIIKDGTGSGHALKISDENRLQADCVTLDEATHTSQKEGELYSWSTMHAAVLDEYILCLRNNDSDRHLCIETVRVNNDAPSGFSIGFGKWATIGGGAEVIGANVNGSSANEAEATCHKTATNFTPDTYPLLQSISAANSEKTYRPEGKIVLGFGDVLYIKTNAASVAACSAIIWGFFKKLD